MYGRSTSRGGRFSGGRLLIAAVIAIFSLISYFSMSAPNPVTGENQRINITPEQEIALGVEAAPQMAQQFGGLDPDESKQAIVNEIGNRIVQQSSAANTPYQYDFYVLNDDQTINAFALPGGQIFITDALLSRFTTEGQLAGVLGHEIGHVVGRHSAEQIAKQQLTQGLTGAAVIAAYDPNEPSSVGTTQMAMLIGNLINMKYGRDDELESDMLGVCFMRDAGYDPAEMVDVMRILDEASQGGRPPEFFSTHPNPASRVERIQEAINNIENCP